MLIGDKGSVLCVLQSIFQFTYLNRISRMALLATKFAAAGFPQKETITQGISKVDYKLNKCFEFIMAYEVR